MWKVDSWITTADTQIIVDITKKSQTEDILISCHIYTFLKLYVCDQSFMWNRVPNLYLVKPYWYSLIFVELNEKEELLISKVAKS